jgi:hypothetical protein
MDLLKSKEHLTGCYSGRVSLMFMEKPQLISIKAHHRKNLQESKLTELMQLPKLGFLELLYTIRDKDIDKKAWPIAKGRSPFMHSPPGACFTEL